MAKWKVFVRARHVENSIVHQIQQKVIKRLFLSWRERQIENRDVAAFLNQVAARKSGALQRVAESVESRVSIPLGRRLESILLYWRHWRVILFFKHWLFICLFISILCSC